VETEGHRPGAYRLGALAALASWLYGARTAAAQLRLRLSTEEAAGRAALALAAKLADGKLTVVDTLELKEAKTKLYRAALTKLDVTRTALLVENSKTLTPALVLARATSRAWSWCLTTKCTPTICFAMSGPSFPRPPLSR